MDLQEFEARYKVVIDAIGNEMQTVVAAMAEIEENFREIRQSIQMLNSLVEEYMNEQRSQ